MRWGAEAVVCRELVGEMRTASWELRGEGREGSEIWMVIWVLVMITALVLVLVLVD